jgi:glycerol-3-phosphate O-acyltransferase/dihydroxyacetone phosphate acyltransferase
MLYRFLRFIARLALRWYYRDIEVIGLERLPREGPLLVASNHPNALVDALVIGTTMPRRIVITAKATLLDHPFTRALVKAVGIVPLRRVSDAQREQGGVADPTRNESSFAQVLDALDEGSLVLLFPEGRSHDEPNLGPLKTGLARMALRARDERALHALRLVAVGLTYEAKWQPRSRIVVAIGEPFRVDPAIPNTPEGVDTLMERVDRALRAVTLNFPSAADAARVLTAARILRGMFAEEVRPLSRPDPPLAEVMETARRVESVRQHLEVLPPAEAARVERFVERLDAFRGTSERHDIVVDDLSVSLGQGSAIWFVLRETLLAIVAIPLATWGRVNHWIPLRLARWYAQRGSRNLDEPAMRTIIAGVGLVLAFYAAQVAIVWYLAGWFWAVIYLISLPISASWDFSYADRRRRAMARARTNLTLRASPELRAQLLGEASWLRTEALAIADKLDAVRSAPTPVSGATGAGGTAG